MLDHRKAGGVPDQGGTCRGPDGNEHRALRRDSKGCHGCSVVNVLPGLRLDLFCHQPCSGLSSPPLAPAITCSVTFISYLPHDIRLPPGVLRPDEGAGPKLSEISSPIVTSQIQCISLELYFSSCFSPCPKHLPCLSIKTQLKLLLFCRTFPTHLSLPLSSVAGLIL